MYGKPISPHWYFICRSLFQWKHNLSDFMFIYFPHCCEVTVAYLAIFILCQLSGGRKHLYFLRAFSYLTVMMIVLTGSTICGLLSCLTVSVDIMKPSNLWAGRWAEATRGTYKLTSGKYGRGSDCWTICVDSTGVVALWPSQNSYWNIRIFLSLWMTQTIQELWPAAAGRRWCQMTSTFFWRPVFPTLLLPQKYNNKGGSSPPSTAPHHN